MESMALQARHANVVALEHMTLNLALPVILTAVLVNWIPTVLLWPLKRPTRQVRFETNPILSLAAIRAAPLVEGVRIVLLSRHLSPPFDASLPPLTRRELALQMGPGERYCSLWQYACFAFSVHEYSTTTTRYDCVAKVTSLRETDAKRRSSNAPSLLQFLPQLPHRMSNSLPPELYAFDVFPSHSFQKSLTKTDEKPQHRKHGHSLHDHGNCKRCLRCRPRQQ